MADAETHVPRGDRARGRDRRHPHRHRRRRLRRRRVVCLPDRGGAGDDRPAGGHPAEGQRPRTAGRAGHAGRVRRATVPDLPPVGDRDLPDDRPQLRAAREAEDRVPGARLHPPHLRLRQCPAGDDRGRPAEPHVQLPGPPVPEPGQGGFRLGLRRPAPLDRQGHPRPRRGEDDGRAILARHLEADRRERERRRAGDGHAGAVARPALPGRLPRAPRPADRGVREPQLRAAVGVLALAGAGIAAYLTYTRYSGAPIACATGGCETVQQSRYALIAGIPVAVLGLVGYAALFATALFRGVTAATAGVGLAVVALAVSAYLLVAQLALIHAVCQWCLASDVVVSLIAVAAVWRYLCLAGLRATALRRSS